VTPPVVLARLSLRVCGSSNVLSSSDIWRSMTSAVFDTTLSMACNADCLRFWKLQIWEKPFFNIAVFTFTAIAHVPSFTFHFL
jgi:hypothetical protein